MLKILTLFEILVLGFFVRHHGSGCAEIEWTDESILLGDAYSRDS